jgi:hypothetical protein
VVSRINAVVTAVDFLRHPANLPNRPSLGSLLSGWRDLNSRPLDPQTSAACPRRSPDAQFSNTNRGLYFGGSQRTSLMVVKMVVRPIAKLSEEA